MKNQEYFNNYCGGLQQIMSPGDYKELKDEWQEFKTKNQHLSENEFRKLVDSEYGSLVAMIRNKGLFVKLTSIEKKLQFFMILTIIGIVGALVAVVSIASQMK